ncbi:ABC transporter permease subunit [Halobacillus amylolyticus]|uniref:ABC transporter permease n=1 Tax=Halobacillus amylolyticus TaxID=2932259 RepID=A0ABY4HA71_9BACI|nr:ABC transporter permease subunit [Halobacillus amylolyticus]UOR11193.1 ABC transporter permease [Halobacillus amylolyticus]
MKIIKFLSYYVFGLFGILLISASPALFRAGTFLNMPAYLDELTNLFGNMVQPSEWVYFFKGSPEPLLPYLWEPYRYSMTIFFGAIAVGFILAFVFAVGTFFLPAILKRIVMRFLNLVEAVPDLLLAFSFQLLIVWLYKQTNVLFMDFVTVGQEKIYWLPIIALAILPMVSLYKIILVQLDEEMTKSYVQMAKSKGMVKSFILNIHILRNIIKSVFYHSKIILWGALSSLLIIEYIFNINGITTAFMNDFRPIVTTVILTMLFTPFFVFYQGTELFIFKENKIAEETNLKMNRFVDSFSRRPSGKWLKQFFREAGVHFKNIKFLIGFGVIFVIVAISVIYTATADPLVDKFYHIYGENGQLVSAAPHSPEYVFLGTDELGFSILDQLLTGAKYTVLFGIAIAFLRVTIGFILAIPYAFFCPPRLQRVLEKLVDGMHFLPLTVIAYLLLSPVLLMPPGGFTTTEVERIIYQAVILTLLAVPLVIMLFGNEMKLIMKEEFVLSTKVLGGSSVHLLWKHLLPHLSARMGIVFGQQFIQTLLIFVHLGVLDIFFGGTIVSSGGFMQDPPQSTTYEWSGLVGSSKNALMTGRWWYIIPPLLGFMVVIIAMQFVIQGIKEVQQKRVGVPIDRSQWFRRLFRKRTVEKAPVKQPAKEDFVFKHSEHSRSS